MGNLDDPHIKLAQYEEREKEMQSRLDELTDFVENGSTPLHWVDSKGIIKWANQAELDLLGYTKEEYLEQPISNFHADENVINNILSRLTQNETLQNFPARLKCKNGSIKHVLINSNVLRKDDQFIHTRCFTRDITGLKEEQAQKEKLLVELEQSEARLRMVVASVKLGTWDYEPKIDKLTWSDECKKIYGLPLDSEVNFKMYAEQIHPEDRDRVLTHIQNCMTFGSAGEYDITLRIIRFDNNSTRWVRAQGKVYFNTDKQVERFIGTVVDITESRQEEIRKNDFIAMVSHELKTPLTAVKSYLQILLAKEKKEGDSFKINALTRAEIQTKKMATMIQDFLSLSRLEEGKIQLHKESFELRALVEEIAGDAQFLTTNHTIRLQDCGDVLIYADRDKIGQVLMNLLSNAIKYSPKGSVIIIGCERGKGKVKIFVKDNGVCISPGDQ